MNYRCCSKQLHLSKGPFNFQQDPASWAVARGREDRQASRPTGERALPVPVPARRPCLQASRGVMGGHLLEHGAFILVAFRRGVMPACFSFESDV